MAKSPGLFDVDERLRRLSDIGDQLEAYASVIDFEIFRPDLDKALAYSDGAKGGRPPFDAVFGPLTRTGGVPGLTVQDPDHSGAEQSQ